MTYRFIRRRCYQASPLFIASVFNLVASGTVYAHAQFKLDSVTPPRYNTDSIKTSPPCGDATTNAALRSNRKGIFVTGETITVEWIETVNHGGSFVFDFAPANDQGFADNPIMTVADTQNDGASRSNPHYYSQAIQLNYAPCEACTLRMRQDMENAQNYYYSCADIVIVSGMDHVAPEQVGGFTASLATNGVQLSWSNAADTKGIIVLRNTAPIAEQPSDRTDYLTGDTVGNAVVVYKGTGTGFTDNSVGAATEYSYKVFAYDADYNYNSGVSQTITTATDTNPGGNDNMSNDSGGAGAGSWLLIFLATLLISQRPAWKKLL